VPDSDLVHLQRRQSPDLAGMVAPCQVFCGDGEVPVFGLKAELAAGAGAQMVDGARNPVANTAAQCGTTRVRLVGASHAA